MIESSQSTVTDINGCISIAQKRQKGLLKMAGFLEQCSTQLDYQCFEQNCSFWLKTLFQTMENHPVSLHAKLAHYCLYLISQNGRNATAELNRTISTNFIEKAVTLLTTSSEILSKNSLMCLDELMSNYRGPCSQFRQKIESYVFNKLDSDSDDVIEWASICYAKLPFLQKSNTNARQNGNNVSLGNSNNNSNNNADMWYLYFKNMLNNANLLLNDLFEDIQTPAQLELNDSHIEEQAASSAAASSSQSTPQHLNRFNTAFFIKLTKDADNLEAYYKRALKRFKACCSSLTRLLAPLREETVVNIRALEIIKFLKRMFLFDFKRLQNDSRQNVESRHLGHILEDMLSAAMRFAGQFFRTAGTNLIVQANFLSHNLAHLGHSLLAENTGRSVVTSVYYECLVEWMLATGVNSNFYKCATNVLEQLLTQIKPFQKCTLAMQLKAVKSNTGNRTANSSSLFEERTNLNSHQLKSATQIIVSALKCLKTFIQLFNTQFTFSQFEKIQETLVDVALSMQYNSTFKRPYDQAEARLGLYENIFELCFTQNSKIAPPISIAITLFRTALHDSSTDQSLNCLRAFTLPTRPVYLREYSLQPISIEQQTTILPTTSTNTFQNYTHLNGQQQHHLPIIANNLKPNLNGTDLLAGLNASFEMMQPSVSAKRKFSQDLLMNHDNNEEPAESGSASKMFISSETAINDNGLHQNKGTHFQQHNGDNEEAEEEDEEHKKVSSVMENGGTTSQETLSSPNQNQNVVATAKHPVEYEEEDIVLDSDDDADDDEELDEDEFDEGDADEFDDDEEFDEGVDDEDEEEVDNADFGVKSSQQSSQTLLSTSAVSSDSSDESGEEDDDDDDDNDEDDSGESSSSQEGVQIRSTVHRMPININNNNQDSNNGEDGEEDDVQNVVERVIQETGDYDDDDEEEVDGENVEYRGTEAEDEEEGAVNENNGEGEHDAMANITESQQSGVKSSEPVHIVNEEEENTVDDPNDPNLSPRPNIETPTDLLSNGLVHESYNQEDQEMAVDQPDQIVTTVDFGSGQEQVSKENKIVEFFADVQNENKIPVSKEVPAVVQAVEEEQFDEAKLKEMCATINLGSGPETVE